MILRWLHLQIHLLRYLGQLTSVHREVMLSHRLFGLPFRIRYLGCSCGRTFYTAPDLSERERRVLHTFTETPP